MYFKTDSQNSKLIIKHFRISIHNISSPKITKIIKVACRVKTNTTWTTKNTTSSNYFSEKFKTDALEDRKRYMKIFELEINNLRIQILAPNWRVSLENSTFCELQVLIELVLRYNFQLSIFILQESSKRCLIFSYFFAVFEKWANLWRQELLFSHILKEC